jgi:hypothetical protein
LADAINQHLSTQAAQRMGPCVRRDDAKLATATHHSQLATHHPSSPRTRGPITTGVVCGDCIEQHLPTEAALRMGPCIDNFPFTMTRKPEIDPAKTAGRQVHLYLYCLVMLRDEAARVVEFKYPSVKVAYRV